VMRLILENWRQYLSEERQASVIYEISFKKASERLGTKALTKWIKGMAFDEEKKIMTLDPSQIKAAKNELVKLVLELVPPDLQDGERDANGNPTKFEKGLTLEWIISIGINDPSVKEKIYNEAVANSTSSPGPSAWGRHLWKIWNDIERYWHTHDYSENKDIFSIKTFSALAAAADAAKTKYDAAQEGKEYMDADKGTEIFRDDDEWKIYALHNKGAACHFGKGTDWCTAAPGLDYFNNYYKPDDPLFYFQLSKEASRYTESWGVSEHFRPGDRFQFHYGSEQFMDEEDTPLGPEETLKLHKLLMQTDAPKKYPAIREYNDVLLSEFETDPEELDKLTHRVMAKANDRNLSLKERAQGGTWKIFDNIAMNHYTSHKTLKTMIEKVQNVRGGPGSWSGLNVHHSPVKKIAERDDLTPELYMDLVHRNEGRVDLALVENSETPPKILNLIGERALEDPDAGASDSYYVLLKLASRPITPPKLLDKMASYEDLYDPVDEEAIRSRVASNANTSPETLAKLFNNPISNPGHSTDMVFNTIASNRNTPFEILMGLADKEKDYILISLINTSFWATHRPPRPPPGSHWSPASGKLLSKAESIKLLDKIFDTGNKLSDPLQRRQVLSDVEQTKRRLGMINDKTDTEKRSSTRQSPSKRDTSMQMSGLMENWRRYRTLCEQESNLDSQIIQEASSIIDEGGTLSESILSDLAKKYGTTPKEIKMLLTAAGLMIGTVGSYGASVMNAPEPPSIEQSATGGEQEKMPWEKEGRRGGYTDDYKVGKLIKDLAKNYNWKKAPAGTNFVYVPYDQIGDNDFLPMVNMKKAEYIDSIVRHHIKRELERGDINAAKENLWKFVFKGEWKYGGAEGEGYYSKYPKPEDKTKPDSKNETNLKMLPLAWSVAYELYDTL